MGTTGERIKKAREYCERQLLKPDSQTVALMAAFADAECQARFDELTDEQRLELVMSCCHGCGSKDTGCQCCNDE